MRARRDAAIALAKSPGDPWTFAESLAPSAPERPSSKDKEKCGIEDAAKFSEPTSQQEPRVEIKAPSTRFLGAEARMDAALRASADPLDRVVAEMANVGQMRTQAGQSEAVLQQAATATDARTYSLAVRLCHSRWAPPSGCEGVTAEQWIRLDPGNGTPWLYLLESARAAGDTAAEANAMAQMASSTRFDTYFFAPAGAVARRVPEDDADLAADADFSGRAMGVAWVLPPPNYQPLIQVCRNHAGGDQRLEQSCLAVSDAMFEHSHDGLSQSIGGALLFQTTGDPSRRDFIRAERVAAAAHWSPATGLSPCKDLRDTLRQLQRNAEIGEVAAMRERARQFVTP